MQHTPTRCCSKVRCCVGVCTSPVAILMQFKTAKHSSAFCCVSMLAVGESKEGRMPEYLKVNQTQQKIKELVFENLTGHKCPCKAANNLTNYRFGR